MTLKEIYRVIDNSNQVKRMLEDELDKIVVWIGDSCCLEESNYDQFERIIKNLFSKKLADFILNYDFEKYHAHIDDLTILVAVQKER